LDWLKVDGTLLLAAQTGEQCRAAVELAAILLRQGKLVAFPTETVYGLGANALEARAVERIFAAKGRPSDNPLIVHLAGTEQLGDLAENIPEEAWRLAGRFWPGPLTLVLKSRKIVPREVTGGLDSVALRVPAHPLALALLRQAGLPVAAPSANVSGGPSPTTAAHVLEDLAGRIEAVLDGGPCAMGVESTVLDIRGGRPVILRPGGVTAEEISAFLGIECPVASWPETGREPPPSPGLKYAHYAPRAPLYLVLGRPEAVLERLVALRDEFLARGLSVGLLLSGESAGKLGLTHTEILGPKDDVAALAANLYGALRRFDRQGIDIILAEGHAEQELGVALMNKLRKAAGPRLIEAECMLMGKKVLFVCSGNTCRSPLAEAFARYFLELAGEDGWMVASAGLSAVTGSPASASAVTVAGEFGLDLSGHRARQLTEEQLDGANLVLVMTGWHKARVLEIRPHLAGKV
jgi:L-threonylcarbamoyladenylate synthase